MSEPIKIVVVADTSDASAALAKIPPIVAETTDETERYNKALMELAVRQEEARRAAARLAAENAALWRTIGPGQPGGSPGLGLGFKQGAKEAENFLQKTGQARMGLMELEHTARATTDVLLMGGNTRMLLAQIPQMLQSLTLMGIGLSTIIPWVAGVTAAVGAGYLGWKEYMGGVNDTTEEIKKMTDALDKLPALLEKVRSQTRAGLLSPAAGAEFQDYLGKNPKIQLYKRPDGSLTRNPTETLEIQNSNFGMAPGTGAMTSFQSALPKATPEEAQKYVEAQLATAAQAKAKNAFTDSFEKASLDTAQGVDKIILQIQDKYTKMIADLQAKLADAAKMGLVGPNEQRAAQEKINQLRAAEALEIQAARQKAAAQQQKAAAEQEQKDKQTLAQWTAEQKQMAAQQDKALEDAIVANRQQARDKTVQLYQQEYDARVDLYRRQLAAGIISEDELTHLVLTAETQRIAGEKAYQAEIKKTAQLKQELERSEAEARLHTIQSNPFLSESAKAQASIGPIQGLMGANATAISSYQNIAAQTTDESARIEALTKVNDLTQKQVDLQRQLDAARGNDSFTYQLGLAVTHLQDMNNLAKEVSQTFQSVFNGAISSVSRGITGLVMGTMTWRQFLMEIPRQILTEIVGAIVQMGVRWVATQVMMDIAGRSIMAASLATTAPLAAAQSLIWAAPATLSTIATMGASAAAAPGLIALSEISTMALSGFESGGYTGGIPGQVAGIVHGGEYVISAPAVRRIGLDNLEAMHRGTSGSAAAGGMQGGNVNLHFYDERPHPRDFLGSAEGENQIVNIARKNRLKIGIQT